ncbi:hypothetical protein PISL3812_03443 [Talaromyces islandicus]|uniref:Uncharacterized protein n=1 Tax=Talaromyces islandicus TaxID=28573 RepID=A0A0U1LSR4_TALIS|nr:hypothetical protein PISL3812_03443 [Talaromyces islandicus]
MPTTRDDPSAKRSDETRKVPVRQPSKTSSIPTPTFAANHNSEDVGNRRKSLLPQRSISMRQAHQLQPQSHVDRKQLSPDQPTGIQKPAMAQRPRSGLEDTTKETSQTQIGKKPVAASRTRTDRGVVRPRSPLKMQQQKVDGKPTVPSATPASPTKRKTTTTQMLPPPPQPSSRPTRSASLRQPPAPKIASREGKGHTRHKSQVLPSSTATPHVAGKVQRPAFNTFQQHFSPKKAGREIAASTETNNNTTTTTTSRSEGDVLSASRPDVTALQTELLQLYLLYSLSVQQDAEWRSTAELQLRKKYNHVANTYQGQLAEERVVQQQWNMKALHDWSVDCASNGNALEDFSTQIQNLSQVIQEVADVTMADSGRYTLVVRAFEGWLTRVEEVKESRRWRKHAFDTGPEELQFVYPMDRAWKDEVEALSSKAELCLRRLQNLTMLDGDDNGGSALMQIARGHRDLLVLMIDELKAMREIELEVVALEKSWVSRAADRLRNVEDGQHISSTTRKGIWTA